MKELKPCPHCYETKPLFFYDYPIGAFAVCCANCGMRGPASGYSKDEAIKTWNALPRCLRWTKEEPLQDGWYWIKLPTGQISIVFASSKTLKSLGGDYDMREFRYLCPEWAGPISEPEENK